MAREVSRLEADLWLVAALGSGAGYMERQTAQCFEEGSLVCIANSYSVSFWLESSLHLGADVLASGRKDFFDAHIGRV